MLKVRGDFMSQTRTLELTEVAYNVLMRKAMTEGKSVDALIVRYFEPQDGFSEEELKAADERLFAFCGAVSSGDPHSCDNERIDLDLALAYGDDHASLYKPKS
jgi:hypothetical protein